MGISKNIFYNLISQVPQLLSGILVSILSTRILGPEGKGIFGIITYDIMFFGLLMGLGVNMAASFFIASKQTDAPKILGLGLYHLILNTTALALFLFGLHLAWPQNSIVPSNDSFSLVFIYVIVAFALNYFMSTMSSVFYGSKKFKYLNRSLIIKAIVNLSVFGCLYWIHLQSPLGIDAVILASLLVIIIQSIYWLVAYIIEFGAWPVLGKSVREQITLLLSFSIIGYFSNLLNFLNYRLDIYIVESYTTLDQVGFYILAVNLTQMLWLVSDPIAGIIKPYLADPKFKPVRIRFFEAYQRLNATIIMVLSIIGWLLAEWLIPLLYGEAFRTAVIPFRILLIGNFFACSSKVYGVYNFVSNKIKYNLQATAVGLIMTISFDFLWIPSYGITGAAWASNVAYFAIFVYLVAVYKIKLGLKLSNLFIFTPSDFKFLKNEQRS